jgi:NAD+ kinase
VDTDSGRLLALDVVQTERFCNADLVIAFGGDGTLIRAAHLCAYGNTPILGVYYGRFGFVTQCTGEELFDCLEKFLNGESRIEKRMMLDCQLIRNGATVAEVLALNEIVLQRSITARMMTFAVTVDGLMLTRYPADGVMVTTPTGSTAYNLSVGGPIIDPTVEALGVTPIAPHTLTSRSLILNADSVVRLSVKSSGDAVLSADGQTRLHILSGDEVCVKKSDKATQLVTVRPDDFLLKLSQRLFTSVDHLEDHP